MARHPDPHRVAADLVEQGRELGVNPATYALALLDGMENRDAGQLNRFGINVEEFYAVARRSVRRLTQTDKVDRLVDVPEEVQ